MAHSEKIICKPCQEEGRKSQVFEYSRLPPFNESGGHYDYEGNWVDYKVDVAPWYQCDRGHI